MEIKDWVDKSTLEENVSLIYNALFSSLIYTENRNAMIDAILDYENISKESKDKEEEVRISLNSFNEAKANGVSAEELKIKKRDYIKATIDLIKYKHFNKKDNPLDFTEKFKEDFLKGTVLDLSKDVLMKIFPLMPNDFEITNKITQESLLNDVNAIKIPSIKFKFFLLYLTQAKYYKEIDTNNLSDKQLEEEKFNDTKKLIYSQVKEYINQNIKTDENFKKSPELIKIEKTLFKFDDYFSQKKFTDIVIENQNNSDGEVISGKFLDGKKTLYFKISEGILEIDTRETKEKRAALGFAISMLNGKKTLHLTFKGTENQRTVGDYLHFKSLHYSMFEPFIDLIRNYVKKSGIQEIQVSGHSLGAAMSEIFLTEITKKPITTFVLKEQNGQSVIIEENVNALGFGFGSPNSISRIIFNETKTPIKFTVFNNISDKIPFLGKFLYTKNANTEVNFINNSDESFLKKFTLTHHHSVIKYCYDICTTIQNKFKSSQNLEENQTLSSQNQKFVSKPTTEVLKSILDINKASSNNVSVKSKNKPNQ